MARVATSEAAMLYLLEQTLLEFVGATRAFETCAWMMGQLGDGPVFVSCEEPRRRVEFWPGKDHNRDCANCLAEDGRQPGVSSCALRDREDGGVGLPLDDYDQRCPLIIDLELVYSRFLGGKGNDIGRNIAVDNTGNAYAVRTIGSTDFPLANPV